MFCIVFPGWSKFNIFVWKEKFGKYGETLTRSNIILIGLNEIWEKQICDGNPLVYNRNYFLLQKIDFYFAHAFK